MLRAKLIHRVVDHESVLLVVRQLIAAVYVPGSAQTRRLRRVSGGGVVIGVRCLALALELRQQLAQLAKLLLELNTVRIGLCQSVLELRREANNRLLDLKIVYVRSLLFY